MKIKLLKPRKIRGVLYPAGTVISMHSLRAHQLVGRQLAEHLPKMKKAERLAKQKARAEKQRAVGRVPGPKRTT